MTYLVGPFVEHIPSNLSFILVEGGCETLDDGERLDGQLGAEVFQFEANVSLP